MTVLPFTPYEFVSLIFMGIITFVTYDTWRRDIKKK